MKRSTIVVRTVPKSNEISRYLENANFIDCYEVPVDSTAAPALALWLAMVSRTPEWVERLMIMRNRIATALGLKDLGTFRNIDREKPIARYRVGDRVGIFSVLYLSDEEVILSDTDKHLDVKVSVGKLLVNGLNVVEVSTVVHVHNMLGFIYLLVVKPFHRLIAPATLSHM